MQAVGIDVRPRCSIPLHEFFNPAPSKFTISAVSKAKVTHRSDEVFGVASRGIDYPAFAASHDQQVDSASAESCYEFREGELLVHIFDDMWIVKPLIN